MANDNLAMLVSRMILIIEDHCQGIAKDSGCLVETYFVLIKIRYGFSSVPFKSHHRIIARTSTKTAAVP